jgi:hypothetical protein
MRDQRSDTRPILAPPAARVLVVLLASAAAGDSAALESASPAEPARQRAVFVCRDGGVPVFADRPCSSALQPRTLAVDVPAPGAVPSTTPPAPRATTRPRPQPDGRGGTGRTAETRCTTLQRQLDDLDDRMRAGYSSREAARLWNRWRELKGRLHAERC